MVCARTVTILCHGESHSPSWVPLGCGEGLTGTLASPSGVLYMEKDLNHTLTGLPRSSTWEEGLCRPLKTYWGPLLVGGLAAFLLTCWGPLGWRKGLLRLPLAHQNTAGDGWCHWWSCRLPRFSGCGGGEIDTPIGCWDLLLNGRGSQHSHQTLRLSE